MTEPMPDMDFTGPVTDLPALKRYNEKLIAQFRANAGELTGQLAGLPMLLLTTVGAKSGLSANNAHGVPARRRLLRRRRIEGRSADTPCLVPQPSGRSLRIAGGG